MEYRQPAGDDSPFKNLMEINMRHRAGHWVRHGSGPAVHDVRQWEKDGAGKTEKGVEFVVAFVANDSAFVATPGGQNETE